MSCGVLRGCEDAAGRTGEADGGRRMDRQRERERERAATQHILAGEAKNEWHMCGNYKSGFAPLTSFKHYLQVDHIALVRLFWDKFLILP